MLIAFSDSSVCIKKIARYRLIDDVHPAHELSKLNVHQYATVRYLAPSSNLLCRPGSRSRQFRENRDSSESRTVFQIEDHRKRPNYIKLKVEIEG